ncbi:MAG: transcription antitermination factor NusB [Candidatus Omnitrophica bacterium]|nr:transcription antitermination factor NusB [Candidatus Omnitrophota bacterium]
MRKRSLAREHALKIMYQAEINRRPMSVSTGIYWGENLEEKDHTIIDFCDRLINGIEQNVDKIDAEISKYTENWQLKRMAVIDRNVLRLGVYEILMTSDIPPKVTINEAVELAKKYGDMESGKFVNGILDKIHKTENMSHKTI